MAILAPVLKQRFFTAAGLPLAGGKLFTYTAGTSTPLATYTDYLGASANANPIILDANGECDIWLGILSYKFILKDSTDVTQWTVDNVNQSTNLSRASSTQLENVGIVYSIASNALTIELRDAAGNVPSSNSPVKIGFRNATLTSGLSSTVSVESAATVVIPSGATLGHTNNVRSFIYVYAINNNGVVELAVSSSHLVERATLSITAIDINSDLSPSIYSTTTRTGVAIRLIARLSSTQTTAGTWAALPSEAQTGKEASRGAGIVVAGYCNSGAVSSSTSQVFYNQNTINPHSTWDGSSFSPRWDGWYLVTAGLMSASFTPAAAFQSFLELREGSTSLGYIPEQRVSPAGGALTYPFGSGTVPFYMRVGFSYSIYAYQNSTGSVNIYSASDYANYNYLKIVALAD